MLNKPDDVPSLIQKICESNREDTEAAVSEMLAASLSHSDLRDKILRMGALQIIRDYFRMQRSPATREPVPQDELKKRVAAKEERRAFLQCYSLWGHKLLADATAKDLRESAERRRAQAAGTLRRAAFEEALARKMGNTTKTAGKFFTEEQIEKIAEQFDVT